MAALPPSHQSTVERKELNLGINHVPGWTVQHAVAELVANAIDQGHGFKYELSPDAMTLVIENPGRLELKHWVMNATGDMKNSDQNGGFGCGMKDALPPLFRNGIRYVCESHDTKYELDVVQRPKEGELLVLNVSSLAVMRPGTTRITLTSTKVDVRLPRREEICFTVPPSASLMCQMKDMEIYADRPSHLPVIIWVRDVYRFEVEDSVGGYLVKLLKLDQGMREKLGRDRRNASSVALLHTIKSAYCRIRDAGFPLPPNIPPQFRPPAQKVASAGTKHKPMPDPFRVQHLQEQVEDLKHQLMSATTQRTFAVEAAERQHLQTMKGIKAADVMAQRLIRQLSTSRLPTFSASKPDVNDFRLEEWIKAKGPSEAFEAQVEEIQEAFQAAFPKGQCAFYGSASDGPDTAMNDSDVDSAVVFSNPAQLEGHLRVKIPLLTFSSRGVHVPNCPTAVMYHWTYKDLEGEVVAFPKADDFKLKMDERRNDPLSKLTKREAKGVKFMKRLRMAAFGGLYPKSRVLTHVVHQVHSKDSPDEAAAPYSYSRYIPLYLDAFLNLSTWNFDYYDRYSEEEWSLLKKVIRYVKRSFGLPLRPGELPAPVEEDTRSSWL